MKRKLKALLKEDVSLNPMGFGSYSFVSENEQNEMHVHSYGTTPLSLEEFQQLKEEGNVFAVETGPLLDLQEDQDYAVIWWGKDFLEEASCMNYHQISPEFKIDLSHLYVEKGALWIVKMKDARKHMISYLVWARENKDQFPGLKSLVSRVESAVSYV